MSDLPFNRRPWTPEKDYEDMTGWEDYGSFENYMSDKMGYYWDNIDTESKPVLYAACCGIIDELKEEEDE